MNPQEMAEFFDRQNKISETLRIEMDNNFLLTHRSLSGNRLDYDTNTVIRIPDVIVGGETPGGWYRVNVAEEVFPWIMEHGKGLWTWDRSRPRRVNNNYLIVRPKLLTLIKLRWV